MYPSAPASSSTSCRARPPGVFNAVAFGWRRSRSGCPRQVADRSVAERLSDAPSQRQEAHTAHLPNSNGGPPSRRESSERTRLDHSQALADVNTRSTWPTAIPVPTRRRSTCSSRRLILMACRRQLRRAENNQRAYPQNRVSLWVSDSVPVTMNDFKVSRSDAGVDSAARLFPGRLRADDAGANETLDPTIAASKPVCFERFFPNYLASPIARTSRVLHQRLFADGGYS